MGHGQLQGAVDVTGIAVVDSSVSCVHYFWDVASLARVGVG